MCFWLGERFSPERKGNSSSGAGLLLDLDLLLDLVLHPAHPREAPLLQKVALRASQMRTENKTKGITVKIFAF